MDRALLRTTLHYRVNEWLQVGVEYNPYVGEVRPLANVHVISETRDRPAVIFNTSTDRIGTPDGQSYTLTISKSLKKALRFPVAPYIGAAYGTSDDRLRMIGGTHVRFSNTFSALVIFDGVHVHPTLTYSTERDSFSLLMIRGKYPGFSYSYSF